MTAATAGTTPVKRVVTTRELEQLLNEGKRVVLPAATLEPEHAAHFDADMVHSAAREREITAVRYQRDEDVQCIMVDHPRHLYMTDGLLPTHNTSNIIFLKSTDDSMIETLSKMSGTTHRVYRDSKTVTRDVEKMFLQVEGKVSYTSTAKEEAVISYNDLAYLPERNSIVFRAGDQPIWNRNETALPMSYALFKNTIQHYGHPEYTLQTIPTLSTAIDFDVRQNQPDFATMLETRLQQAEQVAAAADTYATAYGYSSFDIERLDPDVYADEVLDIVRMMMGENAFAVKKNGVVEDDDDRYGDDAEVVEVRTLSTGGSGDVGDDRKPTLTESTALESQYDENGERLDIKETAHATYASATENTELNEDRARRDRNRADGDARRYAGNRLSRNMLHDTSSYGESAGEIMTSYDRDLVAAFLETKGALSADPRFTVTAENELFGADGTPYITLNKASSAATKRMEAEILADAADNPDARVYAEDDVRDSLDMSESDMYQVSVEFKKFLRRFDDWSDIADGKWDQEVEHAIRRREDASGNHGE